MPGRPRTGSCATSARSGSGISASTTPILSPISACSSCGATSGSFSVKGVSVSYDASTRFEDGLSGATLDGKTVEVDCVAVVTDSGTTYRATRIELDD